MRNSGAGFTYIPGTKFRTHGSRFQIRNLVWASTSVSYDHKGGATAAAAAAVSFVRKKSTTFLFSLVSVQSLRLTPGHEPNHTRVEPTSSSTLTVLEIRSGLPTHYPTHHLEAPTADDMIVTVAALSKHGAEAAQRARAGTACRRRR